MGSSRESVFAAADDRETRFRFSSMTARGGSEPRSRAASTHTSPPNFLQPIIWVTEATHRFNVLDQIFSASLRRQSGGWLDTKCLK